MIKLGIKIILCSGFLFYGSGLAASEKAHVRASMVSDMESILPGGYFWVLVELKMDKGWHTYWKNPGESGLATTIKWELPDGFKAGPILWPAPKRFGKKPIINYGYEDRAYLLTKIETNKRLPFDDGQKVAVAAQVRWLECADVCIPGKADLETELILNSKISKTNQKVIKKFELARSKLPQKKHSWMVEAVTNGKKIRFNLDSPETPDIQPVKASFFPNNDGVIDETIDQRLYRKNRQYVLELRAHGEEKLGIDIQGVIAIYGKYSGDAPVSNIEIDLPLEVMDFN